MAKLHNLMQNSTYILLNLLLLLGMTGLADGKRLSSPPTDGEIEGAIERRLEMDSRIQENKIGVKVDQGHATLFGQVENLEQKGFAEKVALTIRGVQSLVSKLEVPPDMSQDTEMASSIKQTSKNFAMPNCFMKTILTFALTSKSSHWTERSGTEKINARPLA